MTKPKIFWLSFLVIMFLPICFKAQGHLPADRVDDYRMAIRNTFSTPEGLRVEEFVVRIEAGY
jgi:hypothetical protein